MDDGFAGRPTLLDNCFGIGKDFMSIDGGFMEGSCSFDGDFMAVAFGLVSRFDFFIACAFTSFIGTFIA